MGALQIIGASILSAQEIRGFVIDEAARPVNNATVALLKGTDSSVVKLTISKEGSFIISPPGSDSFLVSVSSVGYSTFYTEAIYFNDRSLGLQPIVLESTSTELDAVSVSFRKRLVEVKAGKTVMNVEGTINASGTDALELLKRSPGVAVDKDDNLNLNGKSGVQIYIDNRPVPLNGQDLSSYLKSTPSDQIESIEIIQNPSVSYDASGSAGIINIRLKKNKTNGLNGTIGAGLNTAANVMWQDALSINYRNERMNAYASYSGSFGKINSEFDLQRVIKDTAFDQQSNVILKKQDHSFKTGLDYSLSDRSVIGISVNGNVNAPQITNTNITTISHYPTGITDKLLRAENSTSQRNTNINSNINYSYKDTTGKTVAVNFDYGYYDNKQDQRQPNEFFSPAGEKLNTLNYNISSPSRIDIFSVKIDYVQDFAKGKLGFGGKAGYVKTDNDFRQYQQIAGAWQLDHERSNSFSYSENVNAAYVNYSRSGKDIEIQAGLRAEQTNVSGRLQSLENWSEDNTADKSTFKKHYIDFFPGVNITIFPKATNQFALSYSRRIDRPVYQNLNPFEYRINEYTYHKGSTSLRPQYSNTVSLTHTFKYKLNTTFSYSHVRDVFGNLVDTAQGLKGYLVNANIASQNVASLNISYPFEFRNYSLFANVNTLYSDFAADFGAGRSINLSSWTVNIYAQNSYRFGHGWSAEVSGFYSSPSIWQGTMKASSIWAVDAGVQKAVLNGNGTIKASVSDVFHSMKWTATSNFAGQSIAAAGNYDSRQFKINFTYRFGNQKLKPSRQRSSGLEEEMKRAESTGGFGH
jgi:hypothetical protein